MEHYTNKKSWGTGWGVARAKELDQEVRAIVSSWSVIYVTANTIFHANVVILNYTDCVMVWAF